MNCLLFSNTDFREKKRKHKMALNYYDVVDNYAKTLDKN